MKPLHVLVALALLPLAALAEEPPAVGPVPAADVVLADFLWQRRPVVVFADRPDDPQFIRQMAAINSGLAELEERDVVVITDTDPAARSDARQRLRPRGFSLVLLDKDGQVKRRQPSPWSMREITHTIDRFPLRREEMLERNPSGR
ncbi:DUF4174 domain-containing protein [Neotabrizicola shimadae]|uniref:DUF4174 domain-containing protein n=1 Tax=Neotabrizicola shimadae TaxID=2807096 RepID=A0A8G0ZXA0_9RHOB|nr:DUF4174 domain-containing protein [Neotabrizicola shimadae]QYZ71120.1 DUF4174 domain-containing protein [Neotabrizicola shimadae]